MLWYVESMAKKVFIQIMLLIKYMHKSIKRELYEHIQGKVTLWVWKNTTETPYEQKEFPLEVKKRDAC
ncbi:hypothetical protein QJS04_geneDACA017104 [Acorus gramineus]|uniref:Uncharacterized protein n=1 Tax=Acorus gramineus TaxID=55184 RepID=A0AAV9AV04_ACOGR|nr:hypothetical protein QJS04_geneDACA017104 [Acorus gramineus]